MNGLVNNIRGRAEGYEGPEADNERAHMEAHLQRVMAKYGLIGSESEVHKNSALNFISEPDIRTANGHAARAQVGYKKVA